MLTERPETDAEDLEDVLIQVMSDEYDVVVDDESAAVVAGEIMEIKTLIAAGEMGRVERVLGEWEEKRARRGNKGSGAGIRRGDAGEEEGEESSSEDDEEGGGGDVEMDEAPGLVRAGSGGGGARGRVEPEVDEDGFTKVVGKKKR